MNRLLTSAELWIWLVLPSAFAVQKYFGDLGLGGYSLATAWAIWMQMHCRWRWNEREAVWLSVFTFAGLALLFAIAYPIANTRIPGIGSDDDDALNIAVVALVHGHYPYYARTYLGNLIHHLPGAFLLAAPFVALGSSAIQNLVWLVLFFLVLRCELGNTSGALRWFWLMLIFSPVVVHQLITGTGHIANAIYVMVGLWWLVNAEKKTLPAATWGAALSSRANFLLLIPLAFGWLAQRHGWKNAVGLLTLTCSVCALLTLPFYFYDPQRFAPLEAVNRLSRFELVVPYAGWAIGIGMALLSIILAARPMHSASALWRNCAVVQAFPVITGYLLGRDLSFLSYGSFFLVFGLLAASGTKQEQRAENRDLVAENRKQKSEISDRRLAVSGRWWAIGNHKPSAIRNSHEPKVI
jgi:hypothetical protein